MHRYTAQDAIRASRRASHHGIRNWHGAALYHGQRLVATASNVRLTSRTKDETPNVTRCAERVLLKKIPRGLRRSELVMVVARCNDGRDEPQYSEPCHRCKRAIQRAGIGLVLYT